jgi:hypothetical protein
VRADEAAGPHAVPLTRDAMKQALEDLKKATPRIPAPPLTAAEKAKLAGRGDSVESRLRLHYLPAESRSGGFSREPDPNMTLDFAFKTMLFWIVSRVNNCHY